MTHLKPLTLALLLVAGTAGADEPQTRTKTIRGHEYIIAWLQAGIPSTYSSYGSASIIHSASCTNHAPTVITNTVYVAVTNCQPDWIDCLGNWREGYHSGLKRGYARGTNECKHVEWAERKRSHWLGDGKIETNNVGGEVEK